MKKLKLKKTKKSNFTKKLLIGTGFLVLTFLAVSGYYLARYGVGPLTYFSFIKPTLSSINCIGGRTGDCWNDDLKQYTDITVDTSKVGKDGKSETTVTYKDNGVDKVIKTSATVDKGGNRTASTTVTDSKGTVLIDRKTNDAVDKDKKLSTTKTIDIRLNPDGTHSTYNTTVNINSTTGKRSEVTTKDGTTITIDGKYIDDKYDPTKNGSNNSTTSTTITTTINCNVTCATIGSPVCSGSYVMSGAGWSGGAKSAGGGKYSADNKSTDRECMLCGADGNYSGSESCGYLLEKHAPVVLGPDMNSSVFGGIFAGSTTGACFEKRGSGFVQLPFGVTGQGTNSNKVCGANGAWVDKPQLSAADQAKLDQAAKAQELADAKQSCEAGAVNTYYRNANGSYACISLAEALLLSGQNNPPLGKDCAKTATCTKDECNKIASTTGQKCTLIQGTGNKYGLVGKDFTGGLGTYSAGRPDSLTNTVYKDLSSCEKIKRPGEMCSEYTYSGVNGGYRIATDTSNTNTEDRNSKKYFEYNFGSTPQSPATQNETQTAVQRAVGQSIGGATGFICGPFQPICSTVGSWFGGRVAESIPPESLDSNGATVVGIASGLVAGPAGIPVAVGVTTGVASTLFGNAVAENPKAFSTAAGSAGGCTVGGTIGSFIVPVIGTAVGCGVGGAIGGFIGNKVGDTSNIETLNPGAIGAATGILGGPAGIPVAVGATTGVASTYIGNAIAKNPEVIPTTIVGASGCVAGGMIGTPFIPPFGSIIGCAIGSLGGGLVGNQLSK